MICGPFVPTTFVRDVFTHHHMQNDSHYKNNKEAHGCSKLEDVVISNCLCSLLQAEPIGGPNNGHGKLGPEHTFKFRIQKVLNY